MRRLATTILLTFAVLTIWELGCSRYSEEYWRALDAKKQALLQPAGQADKPEYALDRAVDEAFTMLMQTIPPADRRVKRLGIFNPLRFYDEVWRVGLIEGGSGSAPGTRLDDYVGEKVMVLARLDRDFNRYFEMVERSRLEDVYRELSQNPAGTLDAPAMARWGKMRGLDFMITGATAVSPGMLDISLSLLQVPSGRIVSVGTSKIARSDAIDELLNNPGRNTESPIR